MRLRMLETMKCQGKVFGQGSEFQDANIPPEVKEQYMAEETKRKKGLTFVPLVTQILDSRTLVEQREVQKAQWPPK